MGEVRVWRVENAEGNGPYHSASTLEETFGKGWDRVSLAWPRHGKVSPWDDEGRYVFTSKRQLLDWFDPSMLKKLIPLGYKVRSYVVQADRVVPGNRQAFVRGKIA